MKVHQEFCKGTVTSTDLNYRLHLHFLCHLKCRRSKTYSFHIDLPLSDDEDGVPVLLAFLDVLVGEHTALSQLHPRHGHGVSL